MNGKIGLRIAALFVMAVAIAGLGYWAYNAGVAHGSPITLQAPSGDTAPMPYGDGYNMYHGYGMHMPFFGFGCFGLLLPLFLFFVAMKAFRFMFWGPRWGMMHGHGPWRHGWGGEGGVPPMFNEWHKRAHGESAPPAEEKKE